jgi:hypothetical protein
LTHHETSSGLAAIIALVALGILGAPVAHATSINCMHSGPIVGHPGMEYICYVKHPDGSRETFYAPGS